MRRQVRADDAHRRVREPEAHGDAALVSEAPPDRARRDPRGLRVLRKDAVVSSEDEQCHADHVLAAHEPRRAARAEAPRPRRRDVAERPREQALPIPQRRAGRALHDRRLGDVLRREVDHLLQRNAKELRRVRRPALLEPVAQRQRLLLLAVHVVRAAPDAHGFRRGRVRGAGAGRLARGVERARDSSDGGEVHILSSRVVALRQVWGSRFGKCAASLDCANLGSLVLPHARVLTVAPPNSQRFQDPREAPWWPGLPVKVIGQARCASAYLRSCPWWTTRRRSRASTDCSS
mmetsp:Transcript_24152/g.72589  ORF Transcript_24152/g.72589 Transcript_24152/m.72589 type:complete len:291 (-) Transcript_24152:95-967(-)